MRGSKRALRRQQTRIAQAEADVVSAEADDRRIRTLPWYRQRNVGAAIQAAITQRKSGKEDE